MGWGGGYGGRGGMRTTWGGSGYGYSGYAMGNYSPLFGNFANLPMMSSLGTPLASAGGTMYSPAGMSQSFYFSPAGQNEATLIVHLPPEARLSIEGQQMQSQSGTRVFTSPPLEPGKTYTYTLRAEMNRDGSPVHETKTVDVRPGQTQEVRMNFEGSDRGEKDLNEPGSENRNRRPTPPAPSDR
jgi:uncharacterized protein (TIGR03000 family)